ncbi:ferredoxin [Cryobacterium sp. AP23]
MSARRLAPTGVPPAGAPGPGASAPRADRAPVADRSPDRIVLHIDWTACDGRGLCTELLPELLHRDDWGYPLAPGHGSDVPVPGAHRAAAADAVALCPRLALTLRHPSREP